MPRLSYAFLVLGLLWASGDLVRAQSPQTSNAQAVNLATRSLAMLTGGSSISDITLTGTVTWNGSKTGSATLKALGAGESETELYFSTGARTEIRDSQTGVPLGEWTAPNNNSGSMAYHNCLTDAVWFFPALSSLRGGTNVVLSYIGEESRDGVMVQHIRARAAQVVPLPGKNPEQLSTIDFYLDAATMLPVAATFNTHPDNDANTNLLVEVDYSAYQNIGGVSVPMHIQRYQQGNLMVDIYLSSASFNTDLPLSTFAIN